MKKFYDFDRFDTDFVTEAHKFNKNSHAAPSTAGSKVLTPSNKGGQKIALWISEILFIIS